MRLIVSIFFILLSAFSYCQSYDQLFNDKYGIEVLVDVNTVSDLSIIQHEGITIDHGTTAELLNLYVTKVGLGHLIENDIVFRIKDIKPVNIAMKSYSDIKRINKGGACLPVFDFYPSYEAYEQLMLDFEAQYPDICQIINIKTLSSGRKLLVAHIGDNLGIQENEPGFLYTSSMHGDELAGFPTMLKFIDHLLCNYGTDERLTELVDNVNIFINPLANPNGAYTNDNSSVFGARRENGSFVDLNRNYPDPKRGENPDGRSYQEETLSFIKFSEDYRIDLSCNIHGGIELLNYPWDTYSQRHADDNWWIKVCRNYADTVHSHAPLGYLDDEDNGVTNGFDWFEAAGTRQDHITYFKGGREFTLEISSVKLIDSDMLPNIWAYNKDALVNYLNESLFGLRGTVTDCQTGLPIKAEILIENYDIDNSSVFSDSLDGRYFRFLGEGEYLVTYIAEGYDTMVQVYDIVDKSSTFGDVELCPSDISMTIDNIVSNVHFTQEGNLIRITADNTIQPYSIQIYSMEGRLIQESKVVDMSISLNNNIPLGLYYLKLQSNNVSGGKMLLLK